MGYFEDEKCMTNPDSDCFLPWAFRGMQHCGPASATETQGENPHDHMKEDKETSQTHSNKIPNNILEAVLEL